MANQYARAMDNMEYLRQRPAADMVRVLHEVAKAHPKYFNDAFKAVYGASKERMPEWEIKARALVRDRKKVEAIRLIREHTRLGLKEAKERADAWG